MSDYWGKHHALITSVDKPSRAQVGQFGPTLPLPKPQPYPTPNLPYNTLPYPTLSMSKWQNPTGTKPHWDKTPLGQNPTFMHIYVFN